MAAAVSGGHGPCLTVQHAAIVATGYMLSGASVTVNIGTGSFAGVQLTGYLSGSAGAGFGSLLILNGNGSANTTLTQYATTGIDITASSGLLIEPQNLTLCNGDI